MKKIGLIGGSGPESTLIYYKELNTRLNKKSNGTAFPEMCIESVNLFLALGFVKQEDYEGLKNYLLEKIYHLEDSGCDMIALTAVTLHVVYDELVKHVHVPMISIPEAAGDYAVQMGYKRVGLLGTIFTMEKDYMKKAFTDRGIEVFIPKEEDRRLVHTKIQTELEYAVIKEETVAYLISVIEDMKREHGIEAVILGCTELPLALTRENCPVDVLDAMGLHIERLTELAE